MKINTWKVRNLLVVTLFFVSTVSAGAATEEKNFVDAVDLSVLNNQLDVVIQESFQGNFPYDPEITSFEFQGVEDSTNHISKYLMEIKVGDGKYDKLYLTVHIRGDLSTANFKGLFGIFTGQCLSGKGGFYTADYSDIEGARRGYVVVENDRREVGVTGEDTDVDINAEMSKWGISTTNDDYFVEIATSKLLTSAITGIPVGDIETTELGHSLGAMSLAFYGWSRYQLLTIGHVNHMVCVDATLNYDAQYEDLKQNQAKNYEKFQEQYNSGLCIADGMKTSMGMAQNVRDGDFGAHEVFDLAVSETHLAKLAMGEKPPSQDYFYWSKDCDTDLLVDKILSGTVVPGSPEDLDLYHVGMMSGKIPIGTLKGAIDSGLYMYFEGGFGPYGDDWYANQGFTVENGGKQGHGFMWNTDSAGNWKRIWDYADLN